MAVKIFGHSVSTPAAAAIAVGSAGAIWFAWKQHKDSAATSASTAASPSAIDPVTGLPYSQDDQIDPLTGQAYLAEAQEYGSVSAAENAVAGESSLDYSSAYGTGAGSAGTPAAVTTEVASGGYASNAAWAQAVTAGLTDIGYTSTDVSSALGMYLGGLPLTTLADGVSSASIVEAALAEYGPPPVGSYQIILASSTTTASAGSTSTSTGTASGTTTTSTGTGSAATTTTTAPAASKYAGAISNLRVTGYDETGVSFAWNRATGDTGGYAWSLTSVDGQGISKNGTLPSGTTVHSVTGLTKPGIYNFGIQALPGGPGNNIHTPSLKG